MSTVRSVDVRLDADVDAYIAKMRLAGRETDKAFSSSASNLRRTNRELGVTQERLTGVSTAAKNANTGLGGVDRTTAGFDRSVRGLNTDLRQTEVQTGRVGAEIDRLSGRVRIATELITVFGPAAVPIGALAAPAVAGLSSQLVVAAIAGGSAIVAFQGVADAAKAMQEYELDPTVENLEKMQDAMALLGPDAREFVRQFQEFRPVLTDIRDAAARGWFPGLTRSLDDFEDLAPRVIELFEGVGRAGGQAVEEGAASLASGRWRGFWDFLADEAPATITSLSRIVGDLAHGASEMWMAFDPANDDFTGWLEDVADGFDSWASSQTGREDIANFLDYVSANGPRVEDFFVSLIDTVSQIAQAAAPLGGPVLTALTAAVDVIGVIAGSDLGTPILAGAAALSIYNRALLTTEKLEKSRLGKQLAPDGFSAAITKQTDAVRTALPSLSQWGTYLRYAGQGSKEAAKETLAAREAVRGFAGGVARVGAPVAGLALLTTGLGDSMGITNTASLGLMGTMAGPWGAALGAGVGATLDLAHANDELEDSLTAANAAMESGTRSDQLKAYRDLRSEVTEAKDDVNDFQDLFRLKDSDGETYLQNLGSAFKGLGVQVTGGTGEAENALAGMGFELRNTGRLADLFAAGIGSTAGQMNRAADAADDLGNALGMLEGFFDRRAAARAYEQSLDDLTESVGQHSRAWDKDTEVGRQNLELLDQTSTSMIGLIQQTKGQANKESLLKGFQADLRGIAKQSPEAAAAVAKILDKLDQVTGKSGKVKVEADTSGANGKLDDTGKRADRLGGKRPKVKVDADTNQASNAFTDLFTQGLRVDRLRPRPKATADTNQASNAFEDIFRQGMSVDRLRPNPKVTALTDSAINNIRGVAMALGGLRDKTVHVTTYMDTVRRFFGAEPAKRAAGGEIHGPGTSTSDSIPAMLSDGEFVVRAAAVDQYGPELLHRINSLAFADGGQATTSGAIRSMGTGNYGYTVSRRDVVITGAADKAAVALEKMALASTKTEKSMGAELKSRARLLQKEFERDKARAEAVRQEIQAIESSITSRYAADIFATPERITLERPEGFDQWDPQKQRDFLAFEQKVNEDAQSNPNQNLRTGLGELDERDQLLRQLEGMGLDGPALAALFNEGSIEQIRAYASGPRSAVRRYEELYERYQKRLGGFASDVGEAALGKKLDRVEAELRESRMAAKEAERRVERHEKRMEELAERNPERTGEEVGAQLEGAKNTARDKQRRHGK